MSPRRPFADARPAEGRPAEGRAGAGVTDGPGLAAGTELDGRYRLEGVLGRGGMGEVWRAVDLRLRRPVAVKVLPAELADVPGAMERFEREAEAAAALQHPGITVVFDVGRTGGLAYLVMELLEGEDLRAVVRRHPSGLPVAEAVGFGVQLADALAAAHARGIVHRDIKPANLFVLPGGRLKLCDFGIAGLADAATRLTRDGGTVGTPLYMAPEQFSGGAADARSDLYALGCVLHELLTGAPPFRAASGLPRLMYAHLNEVPPPVSAARPDVPPRLERLVRDLLAKAVDERPASAEAVASLLRETGRLGAPPPPVAPPPVAPPPAGPPPGFPPATLPPPPVRPHGGGGPSARAIVAVCAVLAVAAVLLGVAAFVIVDRAPDRRATAADVRPPSTTPTTPGPASASPTAPAVRKIVYTVTGSLPEAQVQVFHPDGGTSTRTVKLPWTGKYEVESFVILGVSANGGAGSGTLRCAIGVDGEVVQRRSSEGQFASVSCQYQEPAS
ncbi:serine/threonine-protein kinase [Spirillospora sp. NPDC052242]